MAISIFLNHSFNTSRVEGSVSTFQRLYSQQSFREITFLSKSLISGGLTSITIYNHLSENVFELGSTSLLDLRIKRSFITDRELGTVNGELVVYYSIENTLIKGFLCFVLSLVLTVPLCAKFTNSALKREVETIEIEKSKELNLLSRRLSHDLRAPIAVLKDILELDEVAEGSLLNNSLQRLEDIANNLLDKTRNNIKESVNVKDVVNRIVMEKRVLFPTIEIVSTWPLEGLNTYFVKSELERIFSNLLNNALEECAKNKMGSLNIILREHDGNIQVLIKNRSTKLSEDLLVKLNTGMPISTKSKGNGLGVSSAFNILRSNGGNLYYSYINQELHATLVLINEAAMSAGVILHIEDDKLIRHSWKQQANKMKVEIQSFSNFESAKRCMLSYSKDTLFFVDHDLGAGFQDGVNSLLELHDLGFKNLYLTTGYDKRDFLAYADKFTVIDKSYPHSIVSKES